jgi:serine/threonine protein kinase
MLSTSFILCRVKLGADENGKMVAIKRYKKETANLGTLQHELNIMKELQHQNLVQLIDVRQNATYKRRD